MPQLKNGEFISEKQFDILFSRDYPRRRILQMTRIEVWQTINGIASDEGWLQKAAPAREHRKPKTKRAMDRLMACEAADNKCLRCGNEKHFRAYRLPRHESKAVLCGECYSTVIAAALMEFTPEYARDMSQNESG